LGYGVSEKSNKAGKEYMDMIADFWKGVITGLCIGLIITGATAAMIRRHYKDKELFDYAEKQREVQMLREDYLNRGADEFLADPGVRGAVDSAIGGFEQRRDELLQRFRRRIAD
jgi:hypothetical protein